MQRLQTTPLFRIFNKRNGTVADTAPFLIVREREKIADTWHKKGQKLQAKTGIYNLPQNPPLGDGDFVCFFGKYTIDNLPL